MLFVRILIVGVVVTLGLIITFSGIIALVDPAGTKMADDADPFGDPPSPLISIAYIVVGLTLIVAPLAHQLRRAKAAMKAVDTSGIKLASGAAWKIDGPGIRHASTVFRHLRQLVPDDSVLYLEAPCATDVAEYYSRHQISPERRTQVGIGTIWPKSDYYHLPATHEVLDQISALSENHANPEICIHFVVYKDATVLVSGYDAFDDPLYCSASQIPDDVVQRFCASVDANYEHVANFV